MSLTCSEFLMNVNCDNSTFEDELRLRYDNTK